MPIPIEPTEPTDIQKFFGTFSPPPGIAEYEGTTHGVTAITTLLSNILRLTIFAAGLYTLINLIISGIQYIGSSGNPELLKQASSRIWISLLGMIIIAAAIILAAVIGIIFFGNYKAIIEPAIPNPAGFTNL